MNTLISTKLVLATAEMEPRLFDLDWQLMADSVLTMIAIVALFLLLSYFLFNPARAMLASRQNKIKEELDSAADDMEEARQLREQYEVKLQNVEKEAEGILSEPAGKHWRMRIRLLLRPKKKQSGLWTGLVRKRT